MRRIGRLLVLAALLALLLWGSTTAIPGLVDASDDDLEADCQYRYLAFELDVPTEGEQADAIDYANLSAERRAAFDAYLAGSGDPVTLNRTLWNALNEQPEPIHYVRYEETIYRVRPLLRGCEPWEGHPNGTIP